MCVARESDSIPVDLLEKYLAVVDVFSNALLFPRRDEQPTGKFLCVIPPKTLAINHDTGETHQQSEQHIREALEAIEFSNKSTSELSGGGIAIGVGPNVQAFTDNEIIVSFVGHLTNVDYLAWRLFSRRKTWGRIEEGEYGSSRSGAYPLVGGRCYLSRVGVPRV